MNIARFAASAWEGVRGGFYSEIAIVHIARERLRRFELVSGQRIRFGGLIMHNDHF